MTLTNQRWMYQDGVLTVREVLSENDGARTAWKAAWRKMRRDGNPMDMLLEHHTSRGGFAARLTACALTARTWPHGMRVSR